MLVLERHSGESIQIDDDIKLTIYYSKGNQIKMGVEAPRDVSIMREELFNAINAKKNNDDSHSQSQNKSENNDKPNNNYIKEVPDKTEKHQVKITTKRKRRLIMPES